MSRPTAVTFVRFAAGPVAGVVTAAGLDALFTASDNPIGVEPDGKPLAILVSAYAAGALEKAGVAQVWGFLGTMTACGALGGLFVAGAFDAAAVDAGLELIGSESAPDWRPGEVSDPLWVQLWVVGPVRAALITFLASVAGWLVAFGPRRRATLWPPARR